MPPTSELGFDALLTISNQIETAPGVHPVEVDRRKLKRVSLHHLSWAEVLTIAVQQRVHRGVVDPDQAWILAELIRYLEHPKSGALDFTDMGSAWVPVREAVLAGTLRLNDKGLLEVVARWEQLLRFAALRLGRELGAEVQVALSRKEQADLSTRLQEQAGSLVERGLLTGTLRVPDAVGPLVITADIRTGKVTVSVDLDAPREGRPTTRVNWLTRQLKEAPDGLRVEAWAMNARSSASELLGVVREDPSLLVQDPKKELRSFRVCAASALGAKRGTGRGAFIDSVLTALDGIYESVIQHLRPWASRAPQLPRGAVSAAEAAGIDITPPSADLDESASSEGEVNASARTDSPDERHEEATEGADALVEETPAFEPLAIVDDLSLVEWDVAQDKLDRERTDDDVAERLADQTA